MKIVCIDDGRTGKYSQPKGYPDLGLTIGKSYEIIRQDQTGVSVINDNGDIHMFTKSRFEPLSITRNRILEKIGI